jgi:hypothetical protein
MQEIKAKYDNSHKWQEQLSTTILFLYTQYREREKKKFNIVEITLLNSESVRNSNLNII